MTATSDKPVFDLITDMTVDSMERADLDARSVMLIRLAALVAVEAPPVSYAANLALAGETGIAVEEVQALLIAVAPIVGTRVSLRLWETSPAGWGSTSSRWTEPSPPSS